MNCPKCQNSFIEIKNDSFSAMKCEGCSGLWLDSKAIEIVKKSNDGALVDDANEHAAAVYNDVTKIQCPECDQTMIKMVDKDQLHVEYEACANCDSVFFDSSEFKDLADFTLLEKVKQTFETVVSNLKK